MKRVFVAAMAVGVLAGFNPPAASAEAGCTDLPNSKLQVIRVFGDTSVKVVAGAQELEKMARQQGVGTDGLKDHPVLLSPSKVVWSVKITHRFVRKGNQFCAAPEAVDILVGFGPRTAVMAREAAEIGCLKRELIAHHRKHIEAGDAALAALLPNTEGAVGRALKGAKQTPFSTMEEARQNFVSAVSTVLEEVMRGIQADVASIEKRIDGEEELRRIASCGRAQTDRRTL